MAPSQAQLQSDVDGLSKELGEMSSPLHPGFDFWKDRVNQVIKEVVGPKDALAIRFNGIQWTSGVSSALRRVNSFGDIGMSVADTLAFTAGRQRAAEILKTLRWKLDRGELAENAAAPTGMGTTQLLLDQVSIEPDLWNHVRILVENEEWEKVPREAAVFVENRLREWSDPSTGQRRGSTEVFKAAVSDGLFSLGSNSGEAQGWQQIFGGFALAIRNDAGHKLVDRLEMKRYAVAVLGMASLLLGEIRHRYGDPPRLPSSGE